MRVDDVDVGNVNQVQCASVSQPFSSFLFKKEIHFSYLLSFRKEKFFLL